MDAWQTVFRAGIAPQLSHRALTALAAALESDDPALIQQGTTEPPPTAGHLSDLVTAACPLAWCGWKGEAIDLVVNVHKWFADVQRGCWERIGRLGPFFDAFVHFVDDHPREHVRRELLGEVRGELARREARG
jgi:hypothetical protein